jgi:hypothetical protein
MKKREVFKEPEYFEYQIEVKNRGIARYKEVVKNPETESKHRRRLCYTIFSEQLQLLIARYSIGEEISVLKNSFPEVIDALNKYHQQEGYEPFNFRTLEVYIHALWLVSLALLFEVSDEHFNLLVTLIDQDGQDALFDRLIALRTSSRLPSSNVLLHPKAYYSLYASLDVEGEERDRLIDKFLKEYYQNMKETYWDSSHLRKGGFFGYWIFELAAFVKFLNIDDINFANNIYYPRDLTGQKFFRTWEDSKDGELDRQEYSNLKKQHKF